MVVLNRIYTRTGDAGVTGLGDGQRRPKYDLRVEAYGTVDETNAVVGLARLHTQGRHPRVDAMLLAIQKDRKSARLNSSHPRLSRMPSSA